MKTSRFPYQLWNLMKFPNKIKFKLLSKPWKSKKELPQVDSTKQLTNHTSLLDITSRIQTRVVHLQQIAPPPQGTSQDTVGFFQLECSMNNHLPSPSTTRKGWGTSKYLLFLLHLALDINEYKLLLEVCYKFGWSKFFTLSVAQWHNH